MGRDATIDARTQAALARLTDNEKECLRGRLQQQSAKEMALDLGVSPHAGGAPGSTLITARLTSGAGLAIRRL